MFLLSNYSSKNFLYFLHAHINIPRDIHTIHLKMTEVWSKRRLLSFIFIVKSYNNIVHLIRNFFNSEITGIIHQPLVGFSVYSDRKLV